MVKDSWRVEANRSAGRRGSSSAFLAMVLAFKRRSGASEGRRSSAGWSICHNVGNDPSSTSASELLRALVPLKFSQFRRGRYAAFRRVLVDSLGQVFRQS
jgi:hypothetical protein